MHCGCCSWKFAIGKLSACEVQELAMAATKSGAKCGFGEVAS